MVVTVERGKMHGILWRSEWKKYDIGDFWMGKKEDGGERQC